LLEQLVFEKLKTGADALKQQGRKWGDGAIDFSYGHASGTKEIEERQQNWGKDIPNVQVELWDFLMRLDDVSRQALFAQCVSHRSMRWWSRGAGAHAHSPMPMSLPAPSASTWLRRLGLGRVTKARIFETVREANGEQSAQLIDNLKRPT
jgi:ParB family chromosome partitioning protein